MPCRPAKPPRQSKTRRTNRAPGENPENAHRGRVHGALRQRINPGMGRRNAPSGDLTRVCAHRHRPLANRAANAASSGNLTCCESGAHQPGLPPCCPSTRVILPRGSGHRQAPRAAAHSGCSRSMHPGADPETTERSVGIALLSNSKHRPTRTLGTIGKHLATRAASTVPPPPNAQRRLQLQCTDKRPGAITPRHCLPSYVCVSTHAMAPPELTTPGGADKTPDFRYLSWVPGHESGVHRGPTGTIPSNRPGWSRPRKRR